MPTLTPFSSLRPGDRCARASSSSISRLSSQPRLSCWRFSLSPANCAGLSTDLSRAATRGVKPQLRLVRHGRWISSAYSPASITGPASYLLNLALLAIGGNMKSPDSRNLTSSRQPKPVEWSGGRTSNWRGGKIRLLEQGGVNISESFTYHSLLDPKSL